MSRYSLITMAGLTALSLLVASASQAACTGFVPDGVPPTAANRYNCHIQNNHCLGLPPNPVCPVPGLKSRFYADRPTTDPVCTGQQEALDYCNNILASVGAASTWSSGAYDYHGTTRFKFRKDFGEPIGLAQDGVTVRNHGFLIIQGPHGIVDPNLATDIVTMFPVAAGYTAIGVDDDELPDAQAIKLGEPGLARSPTSTDDHQN